LDLTAKAALQMLTVMGIFSFTFTSAYSQNNREEIEKRMRAASPASATCTRNDAGSMCLDATTGFEIIFGRADLRNSAMADVIRVIFPHSAYVLSPQQESSIFSLFAAYGFPEDDVKKCIGSHGMQKPRIQGNKIQFMCGGVLRGVADGTMVIVNSDQF
jgi:hypothetical protein